MSKNYKLVLILALFLCQAMTGLFAQALSGVYTINSGGSGATNFLNFTAFATAINANGVSGPVIVNVVPGSGPYVEQVSFNQITGAGAANRITINGNNNLITFNSVSSAQPWTIGFNGADYFTFNNLYIQGTGATYA